MNLLPIFQNAQRYRALHQAQALFAPLEIRQEGGATAAELNLESQYAAALEPVLNQLYTLPLLAGGMEGLIDQGREEISEGLLNWFREHPEALLLLAYLLRELAERGFNLGGQMALNELGLLNSFELADPTIQRQISVLVDRLVLPDGDMSLIRTTANETAAQIVKHRDDGLSLGDMLPLIGAWAVGRAVIRSATIAANENVRLTRWGMMAAFAGNGVWSVIHECALDVDARCKSGTCPPFCGTEFRVAGVLDPLGHIPVGRQIPLHVGCRCWYHAVLEGWVAPAVIWTGFAVEYLNNGSEVEE